MDSNEIIKKLSNTNTYNKKDLPKTNLHKLEKTNNCQRQNTNTGGRHQHAVLAFLITQRPLLPSENYRLNILGATL